MPDVLLEEINPNGNVQAVVEVDDGVVFLYLFGASDSGFGTRSVWLCNLVAAPETLEADRLRAGRPPRNPRAHCAHPQGRACPRPEDLRVEWLPEGNGAALFDRNVLWAIIPPWSGREGFHGYARDCIGDGPVAWQLRPDNALVERFREAARYWAVWDAEDAWETMRDAFCDEVERALGPRSHYYAIDGGEWPPKALLRIPRPNGTALVTVGVSARPMPNVELATRDAAPVRRIELATLLPPSWSDDAVKRFASHMSGESRRPWARYTWLGAGHTLPCDAWRNAAYTFAALTDDHPELGRLALSPQFGDPVSTLWFVPLTREQQARAQRESTRAVLAAISRDQWRDA